MEIIKNDRYYTVISDDIKYNIPSLDNLKQSIIDTLYEYEGPDELLINIVKNCRFDYEEVKDWESSRYSAVGLVIYISRENYEKLTPSRKADLMSVIVDIVIPDLGHERFVIIDE